MNALAFSIGELMFKSYHHYLLNLLQLNGKFPDFYHAKHLIIDGTAQFLGEKFSQLSSLL